MEQSGTQRRLTTYQPVDENGNPKVDANGNPVTETKEIYIYNEEDPNDTTKQYTLQSLSVNEALVIDETLLPHLCQNGDVDYALAAKLAVCGMRSGLR